MTAIVLDVEPIPEGPRRGRTAAASRAARVAARRAVSRVLALGPGDARRSGVAIELDTLGRPAVRLRGRAAAAARRLGLGRLHLSLTHDGVAAVAFVVAERG